jgi:hypothetical protein
MGRCGEHSASSLVGEDGSPGTSLGGGQCWGKDPILWSIYLETTFQLWRIYWVKEFTCRPDPGLGVLAETSPEDMALPEESVSQKREAQEVAR